MYGLRHFVPLVSAPCIRDAVHLIGFWENTVLRIIGFGTDFVSGHFKFELQAILWTAVVWIQIFRFEKAIYFNGCTCSIHFNVDGLVPLWQLQFGYELCFSHMMPVSSTLVILYSFLSNLDLLYYTYMLSLFATAVL